MNIFACGNTVFFFTFLFNLQKHFATDELETCPSAKASNTTLASDVRELTEVCSPIFSLPFLSWRPPWNISKPRLQNSIEFILSRSFKESAWKKQRMQASVQRFAQGNISHWYYGRMHDTMLDWNRIWAVTNHWFCLWLAYFFAQKLLSRCTLYLLRSKTPEGWR